MSVSRRTVSLWMLFALAVCLLAVPAPAAAATLSYEGTTTGGAASSATVSTSAVVPAAAGQLYLAAITTKSGTVAVRSVSGLGLSWSLVKAQCAGRVQTRVELWRAIGTPAAAGTVTASLSASATNAAIAVSRYSGVDTATPLGVAVSANTRGVAGACSGGIDSASYSVSLTTSAPGAVMYGAVAMRNRNHTPGSGYAERIELFQGSGGDIAGVATEDRVASSAGPALVNGSFNGAIDWAVVAVEIRPGDGTSPTPSGSPTPSSTSTPTTPVTATPSSTPTSTPTTPASSPTPTPTSTPTTPASSSTPTSTPTTPTTTPAPATGGLWISAAELSRLPTSGPAWDRMKAAADGDLGTPTLADYNANHDVKTLAVGLVYARSADVRYRQKAAEAIRSAIGKEEGGLVIMLARNLVSYIITADLINLKEYDPALDGQFRQWIAAMRTKPFSDGTLISEHERRANNHGTMPGASRAAIAVYLGDAQELARTAQIFKGWVGDRSAYASFKYPYGVTWQSDPNNPVAINPVGGMKNGELIDGAMPEEMRRGCEFQYPPCPTGYPWEGLQGALVQANILSRQGYDVWNWQSQALLRAVKYLDGLEKRYGGWWAAGDDTWVPWFVNYIYGTSYPTTTASIGKNLGWTDWMYAR